MLKLCVCVLHGLHVINDGNLPIIANRYCVEFQIESLSPACLIEDRPHARWMLYLREGYTVCVACQHPAMHIRNHRCYGDGSDANE